MADDLTPAQTLYPLNLRSRDQTVVPTVLRLRQVHQAFVSSTARTISLVVQSADKIDLASKDQARSMRHRRCLGAADNVELDFKPVFLRHTRLLEYSKER